MAYVKGLWTRPVEQADGSTARARNERWGQGKRWSAGWVDPEGRERTKAFSTKSPAGRHANAMETDRERGEYIDPEAGKVRFGEVAGRWLASRVVDPSTAIKYESALRLHVAPARKAVDSRLAKLFSLKSHVAVTEQAAVRSPATSWESDDGLYPDQPQISF